MADYQDWEPVVIRKKKPKPQSNEEAQRVARQEGATVETVKKYNAGKNLANKKMDVNAKKLEEETEVLSHEHVSRTLAMRIQQARQAKKLTQKELATKISEKPSIINDYESGRAIPSNLILGKLERALEVKLRGKDI
jgi:putative transcription factor